jgi:hypothetical protein
MLTKTGGAKKSAGVKKKIIPKKTLPKKTLPKKSPPEESIPEDISTHFSVSVDKVLMWSPSVPSSPPEGFSGCLALWEGTLVNEGDKDGFESFLKEIGLTDNNVSFIGCVKRRCGATDAFFWVRSSDVMKFATRRFRSAAAGAGNIRWFSDVYFNDQQEQYPADFTAAFPEGSV